MSREFQDRCIQRLFETNENRLELIRVMSPKLYDQLDPDSIETINPVIVSADGKKVTEDVLFRVKSKARQEESYGFLVLLAHQSRPDSSLFLRMLKAFTLLVERENRTDSSQGVGQNFWPLVIHTGPEKWNFKSLRMQRTEQLKGLKVEEEQINRIVSRIPDFEFDYLDLAVADLEKLIELRSEVSCVLGFMGARRDREQAEKVFEDILAKAGDNEGIKGQITDMLASILMLTGHSQPGEVSEGFRTKLEQKFSGEEATVVSGKVKTWAEELEEKGMEKGLNTLRESIVTLILRRFPSASEEESRKRLNELTELKELQSINERAFDWADFEDVWIIPDSEDI